MRRTIDWILSHILTTGIGAIGGFIFGVAGYAYARGTRPDEENESLINLEQTFRELKEKKDKETESPVEKWGENCFAQNCASKVVAFKNAGYSTEEIANACGVSEARVEEMSNSGVELENLFKEDNNDEE